MGLGVQHILLLLVVVMLLFGRGKVSELMGDVGRGIKSFRKGLAEDDAPVPVPSERRPALTDDVVAGEAGKTC